jgi:hypothetical protein
MVFLVLLAIPSLPQRSSSVDLTAPIPASARDSHLPSGCSQLTTRGYGDGFAKPEWGKPLNISVRVTDFSKEPAVEGGELKLEVELHNDSEHAIKIPWSTDPEIVYRDQSPTYYHWQSGEFIVYIRDGKRMTTPLKSLSQRLYGTELHPESILSLNPGEWVTATIKEKIQSDYPYYEESLAGDWRLYIDWEQLSRSNGIKDCQVMITTFTYMDFYHQTNPSVAISIAPKPSAEEK